MDQLYHISYLPDYSIQNQDFTTNVLISFYISKDYSHFFNSYMKNSIYYNLYSSILRYKVVKPIFSKRAASVLFPFVYCNTRAI